MNVIALLVEELEVKDDVEAEWARSGDEKLPAPSVLLVLDRSGEELGVELVEGRGSGSVEV